MHATLSNTAYPGFVEKLVFFDSAPPHVKGVRGGRQRCRVDPARESATWRRADYPLPARRDADELAADSTRIQEPARYITEF